MFSYIVCLLAFILDVISASAPSFITPCQPSDTACITASAQRAVPYFAPGLPEYEIKPLDPMHLNSVTSDEGTLKLTLTNSTVKGLKDCTMELVEMNYEQGEMLVQALCSVVLTGQYELGGRLVIFTVRGEGPYKIIIRDMEITVKANVTTEKHDDGLQYWHIMSWSHSYDVKRDAHFDFQNLFNGNEILATPIIYYANANWKDLMDTVAPPVVYKILKNVIKAVGSFLKYIPIEDLVIL